MRTPSLLRALLGAAFAGAATAAHARFVEPRWLARTHTRVPVPGLPPALDGLHVALHPSVVLAEALR